MPSHEPGPTKPSKPDLLNQFQDIQARFESRILLSSPVHDAPGFITMENRFWMLFKNWNHKRNLSLLAGVFKQVSMKLMRFLIVHDNQYMAAPAHLISELLLHLIC